MGISLDEPIFGDRDQSSKSKKSATESSRYAKRVVADESNADRTPWPSSLTVRGDILRRALNRSMGIMGLNSGVSPINAGETEMMSIPQDTVVRFNEEATQWRAGHSDSWLNYQSATALFALVQGVHNYVPSLLSMRLLQAADRVGKLASGFDILAELRRAEMSIESEDTMFEIAEMVLVNGYDPSVSVALFAENEGKIPQDRPIFSLK